jgi:hypothetical protein
MDLNTGFSVGQQVRKNHHLFTNVVVTCNITMREKKIIIPTLDSLSEATILTFLLSVHRSAEDRRMGFKNQNHDLFVQKGSIHDLYVHTSPTFGRFLHSCQTFSFAKAKVEVWYGTREKK